MCSQPCAWYTSTYHGRTITAPISAPSGASSLRRSPSRWSDARYSRIARPGTRMATGPLVSVPSAIATYIRSSQGRRPVRTGLCQREAEQDEAGEGGQMDIDDDAPGEHQEARRRGEHERGKQSGITRADETAQAERHRDQRQAGECDRDPFGPLRDSEQVVRPSDDPVRQDRLVEPRLRVEAWTDVVAGLHHGARRLRIERLVGIPQGRASKTDAVGCGCRNDKQ